MTFVRVILLVAVGLGCGGGEGEGRADELPDHTSSDPATPAAETPDGGIVTADAATLPPDTPQDAPPGEVPVFDAAPPPAPPGPEPTPPPEGTSVWSDTDKCNHMCSTYCAKRQACDGTDPSTCRMAIDDDNGGTCATRGDTFAGISQARVQACMDAIESMSCSSFLAMFNSGTSVPSACQGILN